MPICLILAGLDQKSRSGRSGGGSRLSCHYSPYASIFRPVIDPRSLLPLTEVAFEILLSLADGERHGYDILKDIERRTDGRLRLHPGTLYRALARMIDDGLVEQTVADGEVDQRRRPMRMTRLGGEVAKAESARLAALVGQARARRWLRKPV